MTPADCACGCVATLERAAIDAQKAVDRVRRQGRGKDVVERTRRRAAAYAYAAGWLRQHHTQQAQEAQQAAPGGPS